MEWLKHFAHNVVEVSGAALIFGSILAIAIAAFAGLCWTYENTLVAWWCGDDQECIDYQTDFSCPDEFPECNSPAYTGS